MRIDNPRGTLVLEHIGSKPRRRRRRKRRKSIDKPRSA